MQSSYGVALIDFASIHQKLRSRRLWASIPFSEVRVGSTFISSSLSARYLGVAIDSFSFDAFNARTVASCFSLLRQIRSVRRSLTCPLLSSHYSRVFTWALPLGLLTAFQFSAANLHPIWSVSSSLFMLLPAWSAIYLFIYYQCIFFIFISLYLI